MPIQDAPDFQYTVVTATMANQDAPDFQRVVVGPGGGSVSFYKSLTGPGETTTPAQLTQAGPFAITGDLSFFGVPLAAQQPAPTTLSEVIAYLTNYGLFAGLTDYDQLIAGYHPTLWWKLNESSGSTAVDSSGNGHNGTYHGGVTYGGTGPIPGDTAVTLDGSTGYVSSSYVPTSTGEVTYIVWYNTVDPANPHDLISAYDTTPGNTGIVHVAGDLNGNTATTIWFAPAREVLGGVAGTNGVWNMYAFSLSQSLIDATHYSGVFVNGSLVSGSTGALSIAATDLPLFAGVSNTGFVNYYAGGIAQVTLFDGLALSAAQIAALYAAA